MDQCEKCEQLRIEMGIMRQSIDILDGENTELGEEINRLKAENERPWNTPNQKDPWEAYAEWEEWFADQLPQSQHILDCWEEDIDSWFKPQIYAIMCNLFDSIKDSKMKPTKKQLLDEWNALCPICENCEKLQAENDEHFKNIQALNADRLAQLAKIKRLKKKIAELKQKVFNMEEFFLP